ncbi:hypothetical protein HYFRA_00010574 [Hymenoscyphus fraxineus]|uniref:Cyclochlorotine biosynthesis protein O n=1 Tax=Hymenoscyphus fraxineus TaxID=746836 RepID=A0A9N9PUC1_9HELO|nr:hypothetical protein HYFRA_00010574 [Hymenoscyphus fraxineus]
MSKYQPVCNADEKYKDESSRRTSSVLSDSTSLDEEEQRSLQLERRGSPRWIWVLHVVLLSLSLTMFISSWFARVSTLEYVRKFSAYSPAASTVEYEKVKFNLTMGKDSPYVGFGHEVDKAWDRIYYDQGDQMITPDELKIIEMPESSLKVKHPVTGVEGYRVGLEVFHQLHCVNLLRQVTYKEWYSDMASGDVTAKKEELQMHTDHCLEVLRTNIQCNADVGVFTFYMLEGDPLPWPQLNSVHQCRNYDRVLDWANKNSVGNMEKPLMKQN